MKLKLFLLLIILSSPGPALAGPYAEYKNEYEMRDWNKTKSVEHMRFGYKAENNLYFEIGPMTSGHSYESGYKFKFNEVVSAFIRKYNHENKLCMTTIASV